jgi:ribonucleoside-triphosphate reductase
MNIQELPSNYFGESKPWNNLAKVVYKRTYARKDSGSIESWSDTVDRVVRGSARDISVPEWEQELLRGLMMARKGIPAGRGLWFTGSPSHYKIGSGGAVNCWTLSSDNWENFVIAQDLLMLGGGVGMTVEHKYTSKLPKVKKDVIVVHRGTKDADFIVPDSREGWCELTRKVLESFFVTGKSFSYSTVCLRGYGEPIKGFGGVASGPLPLIAFIEKLCKILANREGKKLRPIDAMDIVCCTGEMVVSGNVRRSAILILGDPWDKEYLRAKRWSLGNIPTHRAFANLSINGSDVEDFHPDFWRTYEDGEPYGVVNIDNCRKYGRYGEEQNTLVIGVNPCGEATLEDGESCNLANIPLMNLASVEEFEAAARLLFRYCKRVSLGHYHHEKCREVIHRNMKIGISLTGCLASPLFKPEILDRVYAAILDEDEKYSKELGVAMSSKHTTINPGGSVSKVLDQEGYEGVHPIYSHYMIQRVRFSANDPLIPLLKDAGHYMEPVERFDGTFDHNTLVVDFYVKAPDGYPIADEDWDTWKQLDVVKMAQKHWADQAVSVTVYYKKEEIPQVKQWMTDNLKEIKTVSFLCHSDHGFKQAPKEAITKEQYEKLSAKIKPIDFDKISGGDIILDECSGGACPVR